MVADLKRALHEECVFEHDVDLPRHGKVLSRIVQIEADSLAADNIQDLLDIGNERNVLRFFLFAESGDALLRESKLRADLHLLRDCDLCRDGVQRDSRLGDIECESDGNAQSEQRELGYKRRALSVLGNFKRAAPELRQKRVRIKGNTFACRIISDQRG